MTQQQLRQYLDRFIESLHESDREFLEARIRGLVSVFPFNEYEYILMFLRDRSVLTFDDYERLRDSYVSSNKYLELYGLAPRIFGQIWGEPHLQDLDSRFKKPNKSLDPDYEGQYDLWLDGVRIEVKASRGIDRERRGDLASKALWSDSERPFWMNFQQLKLDICDVFVFIGVWVDKIVYWVLSNDQVKNNRFLTLQHRGGVEYQIGLKNNNIDEFDKYRVPPTEVADTIVEMRNRDT